MRTQTKTLWHAWREQGDESAFEALVRPELPALFDAARRVGLSRADAEDVVQEALAALAREDNDRPGQVGVGAWLMRSVRFRALTARRSEGRRKRHESAARSLREVPPSTFDVGEEIESALARLADDDRQILLLRFVYDLDYREIAYVLGVSENACRIRVHRATGRLRERLGPKAPALLAAIPLADLPGTTEVIAAATKAVASTSSLSMTGGLVVSTTAKMALVAVVSTALTAGAFLGFGGSDPDDDFERLDDTSTARSARPIEDGPTLQGLAPPAVAALDPTDEEMDFLRQALAEERARRAAAVAHPGDSGLDILTRVFEHGMDPWPLMRDGDGFSARVQASGDRAEYFDTPRGQVGKVNLREVDSMTIEFGPGTFEIDMRGFRRREPVSHLQIRGAGMDETTLLMGSELMVVAAIEHLRVSDVTLDHQNRSETLDVRDRVAAAFERVRFLDWASGGYSAVIGVAGEAYLSCRDCEFTDSDGRGGKIGINFRGPALAVLERCTFHGASAVIMATEDGMGSRARLVGCTFEDSGLTWDPILDKEKKRFVEIRVEGAHATFGARELTADQRAKAWGAELAVSVSNLTLEPSIRIVTVADLLRVLRSIDLPRDETLFEIRLTSWGADGPSAFQAATHVEGKARAELYTILPKDGGWTLRHEPRGGGPNYWVWDDLPAPMGLQLALERSGLAPGTVANSVSLTRFGSPDDPSEKRANYYLVGTMGHGAPLIDAATGDTHVWDVPTPR